MNSLTFKQFRYQTLCQLARHRAPLQIFKRGSTSHQQYTSQYFSMCEKHAPSNGMAQTQVIKRFQHASSKKKQASSSSNSSSTLYSFPTGNYNLHQPDSKFLPENFDGPPTQIEFSKEQCLAMYREMQIIRRFELEADQEYKSARRIRGFCHLYSGQEAVAVGLDHASSRDDSVLTAYRDHGIYLARGGTIEGAMGELFGTKNGCAQGKGGSMHFYNVDENFYGGYGIVGENVPVGAGLALAHQHLKPDNVCFCLYGDGAANQGQVFESFNIAKLWNLPVIFIVENNKYGMGTSEDRASASVDYYKRGDFIPGIEVEGMDVFSVASSIAYAKEWAKKNGPVLLEMETYRYAGHSVSDPGTSYRSRDEVQEIRRKRDPIMLLNKKLTEQNIATADELKQIDQQVKDEVKKEVQATEQRAQFPNVQEVATHIYANTKYNVRGRTCDEYYQVE